MVPGRVDGRGIGGCRTGAAENPTWIDIVDGMVEFKDATGLWGLDTEETQRVIFSQVSAEINKRKQPNVKADNLSRWPCALVIGPAGENLSRIATVQHSAGPSFGQGGFGGHHHGGRAHTHFRGGEHGHAVLEHDSHYHHDHDDHHHGCRQIADSAAGTDRRDPFNEECQNHDGAWEPSAGD